MGELGLAAISTTAAGQGQTGKDMKILYFFRGELRDKYMDARLLHEGVEARI